MIIIALLIASYERNTIWKDDLILLEDVVNKSPNKARGYNNLGITFANIGQYDLAIKHYNKAVDVNPDYEEIYKIYNNRAIAYSAIGQNEMAINGYK